MLLIIAIAGYSDAGKTTLVEKLVPVLKEKGYRVGTIKHSEHESNFDTRGKDSWRHFASGADAVLVSSSDKIVMIRRTQDSRYEDSNAQLAYLKNYLADMDVVLVEGFKTAVIPKIEVFRPRPDIEKGGLIERGGLNDEPICLHDDNLIAMVTDADVKVNVPVFGPEEAKRLADFIVEKIVTNHRVQSKN